MTRRVERLNSLLREVISEVLSRDLHHTALLGRQVTLTGVEITSDLSYAKVRFSMMGSQEERNEVKKALNTLAPKIRALALRKVVLRTFPKLEFFFDEGLEHQLHITEILAKVAPKEPTSEESSSS